MWSEEQNQVSAGKEAIQYLHSPLMPQILKDMQFVKLWKSSYRSMGVFRIATINLTEFCTSMRSTISEGE